MQYRPQIIYTRLNDVFESSNNDIDNKCSKNNPKNQKSILESNIKLINKKQKSQKKNKYINKDLIKSWIKVVQSSKHI